MLKKQVEHSLEALGDYINMIFHVLVISIKHPPLLSLIRNQMYDIGVLSLPVVAITGFSTGMVLAAQSIFQLRDLGVENATGLMVTKAMMVELGPVLTAFMVTGRVGASMCAELGTMKVTEQIDALRSMTVDPLWYLISPRFIAGTFMLPLLTVFSCIMGIGGGFLIAVGYYRMQPSYFLDPLPIHVTIFDFFSGIAKAVVFGIVIVTVSCYRGMQTRGGAAGVGRSTTSSVVICYSIILISNFFLTMILNQTHDIIANFVEEWF